MKPGASRTRRRWGASPWHRSAQGGRCRCAAPAVFASGPSRAARSWTPRRQPVRRRHWPTPPCSRRIAFWRRLADTKMKAIINLLCLIVYSPEGDCVSFFDSLLEKKVWSIVGPVTFYGIRIFFKFRRMENCWPIKIANFLKHMIKTLKVRDFSSKKYLYCWHGVRSWVLWLVF